MSTIGILFCLYMVFSVCVAIYHIMLMRSLDKMVRSILSKEAVDGPDTSTTTELPKSVAPQVIPIAETQQTASWCGKFVVPEMPPEVIAPNLRQPPRSAGFGGVAVGADGSSEQQKSGGNTTNKSGDNTQNETCTNKRG